LIIDQNHLPQVHVEVLSISVNHTVSFIFLDIFSVDIDVLALPVKRVNLVLFIVIEAFVREILLGWRFLSQIYFYRSLDHLISRRIDYKVVVGVGLVMVQIHENQGIANEATSDKRICKPIYCHGPVVYFAQSIQIDL
jgi:hypothetical protein